MKRKSGGLPGLEKLLYIHIGGGESHQHCAYLEGINGPWTAAGTRWSSFGLSIVNDCHVQVTMGTESKISVVVPTKMGRGALRKWWANQKMANCDSRAMEEA